MILKFGMTHVVVYVLFDKILTKTLHAQKSILNGFKTLLEYQLTPCFTLVLC